MLLPGGNPLITLNLQSSKFSPSPSSQTPCSFLSIILHLYFPVSVSTACQQDQEGSLSSSYQLLLLGRWDKIPRLLHQFHWEPAFAVPVLFPQKAAPIMWPLSCFVKIVCIPKCQGLRRTGDTTFHCVFNA